MNRPDDTVREAGRSWQRPPLLHVVREPRLPLPPRAPAPRRRDGVAVGCAIAGSMLVGVVLICAAMGWLR